MLIDRADLALICSQIWIVGAVISDGSTEIFCLIAGSVWLGFALWKRVQQWNATP